LLGGGILALLGTSSYLYLAKHIGFTYNYSVFLILFFGGFILGLSLGTNPSHAALFSSQLLVVILLKLSSSA